MGRWLLVLVLLSACGDDDGPGEGDAGGVDSPSGLDGGGDGDARRRLSQEDLYSDFAARTINPDLIEFEPRFRLWSDGALKRRWIELPEGMTIDTSDMDRWVFPVGTRLWKEFRTPGGELLETRLIERVGPGSDRWADYVMGSFVWEADGSEAYYEATGRRDVNGTMHDAPSESRCRDCHQGEAGNILGFAAIQLSKTGGVGPNLADLESQGRLSSPPGRMFEPPGDAVDQEALGYLHANCGNCHNPLGSSWADVPTQTLRLAVAESDVAVTATQLYTTTVLWDDGTGMHFDYWSPPNDSGVTYRIVPGDHAASGIWFRMTQRDNQHQMPPIATEVVDSEGVETVRAWIDQL